jgi:uncharacterized membrane protein YidH (DUF202 family)
MAFSAAFLTIFAINLLTSGVTSFEQEEAQGNKHTKLTKILIDLAGLILTVILVFVGIVSHKSCEIR